MILSSSTRGARLIVRAASRSRSKVTASGLDLSYRTPLARDKYVTRFEEPLELDYGGALSEYEVTWEQWGDTSLPASRTVYIMPSFSNSSHVIRNLEDPSAGWWEGMVGPGSHIDTNRFRVLCAGNLGGPFGTTSPISMNPSTGRPYGFDFPQITPGDYRHRPQCHSPCEWPCPPFYPTLPLTLEWVAAQLGLRFPPLPR
eukprot:SAG11_NODE_2269_length_3596_cov_2.380612_3_plen_200_part_00